MFEGREFDYEVKVFNPTDSVIFRSKYIVMITFIVHLLT